MSTSTSPLFPPETFSQKEKDRLEVFKTKVADLDLTPQQLEDGNLIRWLRARSLDVEKAYEMLKQNLEWRKKHNVDGILEREEIPLEMKKYCPVAYLGLDNDGYPLFLMPMGHHDMREMLEKYGEELCFKFNLVNMEWVAQMLEDISQKQGRRVTQFVEIIDLEGYSYRQMTSKLCRDFMISMQTTFDSNYPELLRYAVAVNAPKIFYILFNFMKPFIPKHTLEKIDIYGPEPEKWKKFLIERFSPELIPRHWGGTRKGSDEYCSQDDIWVHGPVSLSFFGNDGVDETLTQATVKARDSLKITLNVTKLKSSISWKFKTANHDIGLQIIHENKTIVVPFNRVQSHKQLQEGSHVCEEIGDYTVIFDNSYSFARSKSLYYNVSVIEPLEIEEQSKYESSNTIDMDSALSTKEPVAESNGIGSSTNGGIAVS